VCWQYHVRKARIVKKARFIGKSSTSNTLTSSTSSLCNATTSSSPLPARQPDQSSRSGLTTSTASTSPRPPPYCHPTLTLTKAPAQSEQPQRPYKQGKRLCLQTNVTSLTLPLAFLRYGAKQPSGPSRRPSTHDRRTGQRPHQRQAETSNEHPRSPAPGVLRLH